MDIKESLKNRANNMCELCGSSDELDIFEVAPSDGSVDQTILVCSKCKEQLQDDTKIDQNHWHCLNDSMWSETPAVKIMTYILLNRLGHQDMVDMMYLEEDELKLAEQTVHAEANRLTYRDANGVELKAGDSVVILKDLDVKGAGFTAKRGTTVRNISIPNDVEGHIEGRVNGSKIYLKTEFLKKA